MASIAGVVNGELTTNGTLDSNKQTSSSSLNKDAFLQLLVTQMKYQDPLEPTENTEYVSQLATFSELEEMQNMTGALDLSRASALVGKTVTVNVVNEATGQTSLIGGKVDYVAVENGKAFLNINGENYSVDDLDSVVDEEYLTAYNLATEFSASLAGLPKVENVTLTYQDIIENLSNVYADMTDYQKGFISSEQTSALKDYEEKIAQLLKVEEAENAEEA